MRNIRINGLVPKSVAQRLRIVYGKDSKRNSWKNYELIDIPISEAKFDMDLATQYKPDTNNVLIITKSKITKGSQGMKLVIDTITNASKNVDFSVQKSKFVGRYVIVSQKVKTKCGKEFYVGWVSMRNSFTVIAKYPYYRISTGRIKELLRFADIYSKTYLPSNQISNPNKILACQEITNCDRFIPEYPPKHKK